MAVTVIQAVSKRSLIKKQRKFLNSKVAKTYKHEVVSSGYDPKTKIYFVKYNYDTSK